MVDVVD